MARQDRRSGLISNVLAIAALIILIIIVLWGLIHIVSLSSGWFSSLSPATKNSIVVHAPPQATSGQPFTIEWTYAPKTSGTYALLYQCRNDLKYTDYQNDKFLDVPCGSAYTLNGATSTTTVLPVLSASSSVSSSLTIVYIPSSGDTSKAPQGSATVIIAPAAAAPVKTTTSQTAVPAAKPAPVSSGPADLAVTILSSNVDSYGNATVTFDVANVGSGASGVYYFSATLPTQTGYTYTSPAQQPLAAGSHILSTLNFSNATPGSFVVSLSGGNDSNGANNFASQFINAPYLNTQYQSQPIYTPGVQPYYQPTYGSGQCYWNGATYVCNQVSSYSNGLPYYINSGQYPYTPLAPIVY